MRATSRPMPAGLQVAHIGARLVAAGLDPATFDPALLDDSLTLPENMASLRAAGVVPAGAAQWADKAGRWAMQAADLAADGLPVAHQAATAGACPACGRGGRPARKMAARAVSLPAMGRTAARPWDDAAPAPEAPAGPLEEAVCPAHGTPLLPFKVAAAGHVWTICQAADCTVWAVRPTAFLDAAEGGQAGSNPAVPWAATVPADEPQGVETP